LRGDPLAGDSNRPFVTRARRKGDGETLGIPPQLAFREGRGEFFDIGAAGIAGDLVATDGNKRQRCAGTVTRGIPAPLSAEIAVGDVELVRDLAGPAIEKAAQTIEIRSGSVEEGGRVLAPRADEAG